MRFADEVIIRVQAGKGGDGCVGFRREKYIPFGGPDGGDGGDGGSVYLKAHSGMNTLIELRHKPVYKAQNGAPGAGKQRTGFSGEDLVLNVPLGTSVFDADTKEWIGELTTADQMLCVARGGHHGLGNIHFKSSTNRAPRRATKGTPGDARSLRLELTVLADVGLLGMPNAGKSALIRAISAARPKVADYPFTTLKPHLGVVDIDGDFSFVVADVPGLIEGASEGAGLGIQFLKHLSRCKLLLQVVDINELDADDPAATVAVLHKELQHFSEALANKPRWLVLNKTDLLPAAEVAKRSQALIKALAWEGPIFEVAAISGVGLKDLCYRLQDALLV